MSRRSRFVAFGSAGGLVVIGAGCAALIDSTAGQILAMVLIGGGLVLATGLVFLEIGLSEDRERAQEARAREVRASEARAHEDRVASEERPRARSGGATPLRSRPRLGRSRGHRRRLEP